MGVDARLYRSIYPTGFGTGTTVVVLMLGTCVAAITDGPVFLGLLGSNWQHLLLALVLLGVVGGAYVPWVVAHARGVVSAVSGTGFVVAGYAVAQRIFCEFLLSQLGVPYDRFAFVPGFVDMIRLTRAASWVGFAFGLASVAFACWSERRLRRERPDLFVGV